jgi:hypothetical protein
VGDVLCIGCGKSYGDLEAHLRASKRCEAAKKHQAALAEEEAAKPKQRCPKCQSTAVGGYDGMYEFTKMECFTCGHEEYADNWDLWWP